MRKYVKHNIIEMFQTLREAHIEVKGLIEADDGESAHELLCDCQNAAIRIGSVIEETEGEGYVGFRYLEDYCETVYQVSMWRENGINGAAALEMLDEKLAACEKSVNDDIAVKLSIVFFPYKASMWTSFESIWRAAVSSPECEVSVVAVPYCERDENLRDKKWVYEADLFPDYVEITHYNQYNLEERQPDIAFIHNAYDDRNTLTSVLPDFYSRNIKKYTDCLVYSPYFAFGSYNKENSDGFFTCPGSLNADKVVVQSPFVADIYEKYGYSRDKLLVYGSPKIDAVITNCCENSGYSREKDMPKEWKEKLLGKEKIFLLNTHWAYFMKGEEYKQQGFYNYAQRYHDMFFEAAEKNKDKFGVIWRPHPLMIAATEQRCPELMGYINEFTERLEKSDFAVIDRNGGYTDAFNCSDALVTTYSTMIQEYMATGKPVQIFQTMVSEEFANRSPVDYRKCYFFFKKDNGMLFEDFMQMVLEGSDPKKEERLEMLKSRSFINMDGTAGEKILASLISSLK